VGVHTYEFAYPGYRSSSLSKIRRHEYLVKHVVPRILDQSHDGHPTGLIVVISENLLVRCVYRRLNYDDIILMNGSMPPLVLDSFPLLVVFDILRVDLMLIWEILCLLTGQLASEFMSLFHIYCEGFLA